MSLFNALAGAAANALQSTIAPQASSPDVPTLMRLAGQLLEQTGGLPGLIAKLQAGGLGEVVASWVARGTNLPVSGEQLQQALGSDLMGRLAQALGGDAGQTANGLAQALPALVDALTPDGQLPADGGVQGLQALLGGQAGQALGGLLGGLLKR